MTNEIINDCIRFGLIQYGNFAVGDSYKNIKLSFDLLPSYPQLLSKIAGSLSDQASTTSFDYILATHDAISLATLISNITALPLAYERENASTPVNRIIGSYDVGHPTLLVCHTTSNLQTLIQDAGKVGLLVTKVIGIVDIKGSTPTITTETLYTLQEIRNKTGNFV